MPADMSCTGNVAGQAGTCLVRCQNPARAGPFGGVVPVQQAGTATPAQARRALAQAVKRDSAMLRKIKVKRGSLKDEAEALGMSEEDLKALRDDDEEI